MSLQESFENLKSRHHFQIPLSDLCLCFKMWGGERSHHRSLLWWFERKWPSKSGTIRRCGFVRVGVTWLECHCGGRL